MKKILLNILAKIMDWVFFKVTICGKENIPPEEPVMFVVYQNDYIKSQNRAEHESTLPIQMTWSELISTPLGKYISKKVKKPKEISPPKTYSAPVVVVPIVIVSKPINPTMGNLTGKRELTITFGRKSIYAPHMDSHTIKELVCESIRNVDYV